MSDTEFELDPFVLFRRWFDEAKLKKEILHPDVFCLSTVGPDGFPEGRQLLLKGILDDGFVFYTNEESKKGQSLKGCAKVAMTFYWEYLGKQVRIQGTVRSVSDEMADAYFKTRPRMSQIGAWASFQSEVLEDREKLRSRVSFFEKKFEGKGVGRPQCWVGYCVVPRQIEFWTEGEFRLHDRVMYTRCGEAWETCRLYP